MSNLFAFSQAQESAVDVLPSGRYDAEQQLWIADQTSYATERMPVDNSTCMATSHVTMGSGDGFDHGVDCALDY
jgi:hypothetical protein